MFRLKLVEQLSRLIAKVLKIDPEIVGPETGPLNLSQWDSFHHVHIVVEIEKFYQVQLTLEELSSILSVNDIAGILRQKGVQMH